MGDAFDIDICLSLVTYHSGLGQILGNCCFHLPRKSFATMIGPCFCCHVYFGKNGGSTSLSRTSCQDAQYTGQPFHARHSGNSHSYTLLRNGQLRYFAPDMSRRACPNSALNKSLQDHWNQVLTRSAAPKYLCLYVHIVSRGLPLSIRNRCEMPQ